MAHLCISFLRWFAIIRGAAQSLSPSNSLGIHWLHGWFRCCSICINCLRWLAMVLLWTVRVFCDKEKRPSHFGALELFGGGSGNLLLSGLLPELQSWSFLGRAAAIYKCCGYVSIVPVMFTSSFACWTGSLCHRPYLVLLQLHRCHLHFGEPPKGDSNPRQHLHPRVAGLGKLGQFIGLVHLRLDAGGSINCRPKHRWLLVRLCLHVPQLNMTDDLR